MPASLRGRAKFKGVIKMEDLISRQAAIEVIDSFNVFESRCDQIKLEQMIGELPPTQPEQLEQCPIYGGMCAYPSDQCYDCPRHAGAKMEVTT